jgi:hypothetical protein
MLYIGRWWRGGGQCFIYFVYKYNTNKVATSLSFIYRSIYFIIYFVYKYNTTNKFSSSLPSQHLIPSPFHIALFILLYFIVLFCFGLVAGLHPIYFILFYLGCMA